MGNNWKLTAKKGFYTFVLAGIAGLIGYFSTITNPEQAVFLAVVVAILKIVQDYFKHRNDEIPA